MPHVVAGKPDSASAAQTIGAIELAVSLTMAGKTSATVTNPIAKSVPHAAGFGFPGHTEFLADLASRTTGTSVMPVMMIAGPELRTVPVTIHIPLRDVPEALTEELVYAYLPHHRDRSEVTLVSPTRVWPFRLNPHAMKTARSGLEDDAIVAPAIERLRAGGDRRVRPPARRYDVPQGRARNL